MKEDDLKKIFDQENDELMFYYFLYKEEQNNEKKLYLLSKLSELVKETEENERKN